MPRSRSHVGVLALPHLVEHAQIEEAGERIGLRQILDALARLGDVGGQRGREVRDQQKRRQLPDRAAGIHQREHVETGRCRGQQDVTHRDRRHLQQRDQAAQRERAQDDGQQIQIQQRARTLPGEPQHAGDEDQHGPGLDQQSSPGAAREETARRNSTIAAANAASRPSTGHNWVHERTRPDEHQRGQRETEYFDGAGAAHEAIASALPRIPLRGLRPWATSAPGGPAYVGIALQQRRVRGGRRLRRLRVALELDVGRDARGD